MVERYRSRARRPRPAQDGFTMVELLMTMLLLSVVLLGLAALQVSTIRQVTASQRVNAAAYLANNYVERCRAMPFTTLQSLVGSTAEWATGSWNTVLLNGAPMTMVDRDGQGPGPFSVERYVQTTTGPPSVVVTYKVSWKEIRRSDTSGGGTDYETVDLKAACRRYQ